MKRFSFAKLFLGFELLVFAWSIISTILQSLSYRQFTPSDAWVLFMLLLIPSYVVFRFRGNEEKHKTPAIIFSFGVILTLILGVILTVYLAYSKADGLAYLLVFGLIIAGILISTLVSLIVAYFKR